WKDGRLARLAGGDARRSIGRLTLCDGRFTPSPQDEQRNNRRDHEGDVEALDIFRQHIPVLAELVAYEGNDGDPQQRAQEVEDCEALPGHAQNACERAGDHAQAEDEAREKNRNGAVAVEQSLAARNGFRFDAKCAAVTIKEAATSAIADQVTQV